MIESSVLPLLRRLLAQLHVLQSAAPPEQAARCARTMHAPWLALNLRPTIGDTKISSAHQRPLNTDQRFLRSDAALHRAHAPSNLRRDGRHAQFVAIQPVRLSLLLYAWRAAADEFGQGWDWSPATTGNRSRPGDALPLPEQRIQGLPQEHRHPAAAVELLPRFQQLQAPPVPELRCLIPVEFAHCPGRRTDISA